jgi:photosystem II stability/assembly factor-like uncharacterized protein
MKKSILCLVCLLILFSFQTLFSQTWVRKIDGFSMWSIGKDYAGNIYAGTTGSNRGIFKSTDSGETWNNMFSTGASNYLGIACDSLNNVYVANTSNGMLISTDGGQNFTLVPSSTFNGNTINMVACGRLGHIFAGATNGGIWRSTDFGSTFTNTALQTFTIVTIAVDRNNPDIIYAGASSSALNGFFRSTDDGLTFSASTNDVNVWEILQSSSGSLYTATTSSPYPFDNSLDGGLTWSTMSNQPAAMRGAAMDLLEDIYISGNGGVFKSTDGGVTFVNHNLTFSSNKILSFQNKIMVCVTGTTNGGVYIFTDEAIPVELMDFTASASGSEVMLTWRTATETNNKGFEIEREKSLVKSEQSGWERVGFVGGFGTTTGQHHYSFTDKRVPGGYYTYRLKQIDLDGSFKYSDAVEVNVSIPREFSLEQNYPNPFNPATIINYQIPQAGFVTLKVYDPLGNEVAVLVSEQKDIGKYSVNFDASDLPAGRGGMTSGVYIYQLRVNDYVSSKKMLLLK